jgi:hypothetical protein
MNLSDKIIGDYLKDHNRRVNDWIYGSEDDSDKERMDRLKEWLEHNGQTFDMKDETSRKHFTDLWNDWVSRQSSDS